MNIKLIANVIGSLFPIIFPKQEFKPKRLAGVVVCTAVAVGMSHFLDAGTIESVLEITEELLDLAQE